MAISTSISRLTSYYMRYGLGASIRRAGLALERKLFSNRMVLYYCDLAKHPTVLTNIPSSLKMERLRTCDELSEQDMREMTCFWNPKQAHRNILERFKRGASLWLMRSGDRLAGYGWTMQGNTVEPHYFPLTRDDVHLFDFHVFPQYRGQGMNPLLLKHILISLTGECQGRAFIEAAEWNAPQLSSLRKTEFRCMGWARKSVIFHRTIVCWSRNKTV